MVQKISVPFLLALLLTASPAVPQEGTPPDTPADEETFFEAIDVQVVNLEVFVTDREGRRITGLTREDFEVLEDGKPIEISNFYAVTAGQTRLPENAPAEEPTTGSLDIPDEQRLHLAIVLDDLSLSPQNRNRLVQSIESAVLPRLLPDDRALVAVLEGGTVRIAQRLTADRELLRTALQEAMKPAPQGTARLAEKRELLSQMDAVGLTNTGMPGDQLNASMIEEVYRSIQSYARQRYTESQAGLAAVEGFVSSLSGLPGRKAVLYVGGGLSVRPGQALFQAWQNKFGTAGRAFGMSFGASPFDGFRDDLTADFQKLVEHANANRVTFYTLGAVEELGGISAESRGSDNWGRDLEGLEKINIQQSLETLAGGTGGLAAIDLFDPRSILDRMREDFDSYYSLGYVPERRRDGKDRRIEVRVRGRQDLKVRHREGRRDQTHKERMTDRTLAALTLEPGANPLEVAVDFLGEKQDRNHYAVDVLVKFPLAKLVLLPKERFHEGKVKVFVGARDSRGRMSPIQEIDVPIRVPNDQLLTALGQTAAYKTTLLLRPDLHTVAVSLRDELGNAESAVAVEYRAGKGL